MLAGGSRIAPIITGNKRGGVRETIMGAVLNIVGAWAHHSDHDERADPNSRTGIFNPQEARYTNRVVVDRPYPTADVRMLTKTAIDALYKIFWPGFKYSKA